jgi:hypothetical protein
MSQSDTLLDSAEIGQKAATRTQIEAIDLAIRANPVENFDLARVVNVFAAYIQFYEFEGIHPLCTPGKVLDLF